MFKTVHQLVELLTDYRREDCFFGRLKPRLLVKNVTNNLNSGFVDQGLT